jgi:tetratricopeptide (TPR) repeat protein
LDLARAYLGESLSLSRALGDTARTIFTLNGLGLVYLQIDLAEAERVYKEAHTLALATGNRERTQLVLGNLGEVSKMRGNWADARALHQQALALARELGARQFIALDLLNLAGDSVVLRDYPAARTALREGLALARELGALPWVVGVEGVFADLFAAEGNTSRALALIGLCQRHPAFSSDHRREVDAMLARWNLDAATVEAGLAQGAALEFDATVEEIARELAQDPKGL